MVRVETDRSGWSRLQDPETGERVPLDEDIDPDVAERLVDEYAPAYIADDTEDEGEEDEDEGEAEQDDVDELLEGTVAEVEDALASGDYDDRLDEIEDRADRQGVADAVDDRREE